MTDVAQAAITRFGFPENTPVVASVKQYMENVPGRKDVLEINMLAEVARRQSRTQLSAYLMVFEDAYTKQASVNEETRPNKARTPKNTNNFEPCVARTTRGLAKM
jgi:hypothetical protein